MYAPNAVFFDGANDYLTRAASLGAASSKLWSGSMWVRDDNWNSFDILLTLGGSGINGMGIVQLGNGATGITFAARTAGTTNVCLNVTTAALTNVNDGNWHHVMWAFDMANQALSYIIFDGVDVFGDATVTTFTTDALIGFDDNDEYYVGGISSGSYDGGLADLWCAPGVYLDLSDSAVIAKFISGGAPVNLGADGSLPNGTAPLMFFTGTTDVWHANAGSGGAFTENGALTDDVTPVAL